MAKIVIIKDNCRTCGNHFSYEYQGEERQYCDSHMMTVRYVEPINKPKPTRVQRDVWLAEVTKSATGSQHKTKSSIRIGICEVGEHEFQYTGKGRNRKRCDEHPRRPRKGKGPRKGICEVCSGNFEYTTPGRPRTRCDEHPKEVTGPSHIRKRSPEEIVNQLMEMLESQGKLLRQQKDS